MNKLFIFLILSLFGWQIGRNLLRQRAIKKYVQIHSYSFAGSTLPKSLALTNSSFRKRHSIENAFAGEKPGCDFVYFDCRIRRGKGSYLQSILAVRPHGTASSTVRFPFEFDQENVDHWTLIFQAKRKLEVSEIDAIISLL
jgi:hypothetical protein